MASVWREPIFDRTQEDVDFAIRKIAEWIAYNISAAEYDEKVRIENEKLVLQAGNAAMVNNNSLVLQGEGRAYVENDALVVRIGVVYDLKACLNVLDLNRIEENIAYLAERLAGSVYSSNLFTERLKYKNGKWIDQELHEDLVREDLVSEVYPFDIVTKKWGKGDLPTELDIQRIISNIKALIGAFYKPSNAPELPPSMLSYDEVNAIERNIYLIKYLLDCMVNSFRKTGAVKSGTTSKLPIRR